MARKVEDSVEIMPLEEQCFYLNFIAIVTLAITLEYYSVRVTIVFSNSLWLSRCPCLFTSCRCWNKLALVRGATVAASVIEYLLS